MTEQKVDELIIGSEGVKEVPAEPPKISLFLVHDQHPALRTVIEPYNHENGNKEFVADMVGQMAAMMDQLKGIGLAANQVNLNIRVFVMRRIEAYEKDGITADHRELLVCFNPVVIQTLEAPFAGREGCLSYPGLSLQVKRPNGVLVQFEDIDGQLFELELFGIDARCFQHELDHLNGIVFTTKVNQGILNWELEKQRKLIKKARKNYARFAKLNKEVTV